MIDAEELEPIESREAREALKLLVAEGESLLRQGIENFGEYRHWVTLSFTALEPLPKHQEFFNLKCWQKRGSAEDRLSEGIYLLKQAVRAMDDPNQVNLANPSISYRRLIASIPD